MKRKITYWIMIVFLAAGCASTQKNAGLKAQEESVEEVSTAIQSVLGAVSGQDVDEQKLREMTKEIQKDEEARSAVETISNTMGGNVVVKYCPIDGERYSADIVNCPKHNAELKIVE